MQIISKEFARSLLKHIMNLLFRVEVEGLEHYKKIKGPAIVIANHVSFLDGVLIAVYLPIDLVFAIYTNIAKRWWMRWIHFLTEILPLDPINPMSIKSLIAYVDQGKTVVIFPEGRVTVTGTLMKIYEGAGLVADKTKATLLPIWIEGLQYSIFSRHPAKRPFSIFPKIILRIMPAVRLKVEARYAGRQRRQVMSQKLYTLMAEMMFHNINYHRTLFQSLLQAWKLYGSSYYILEDTDRKPLSYKRFIIACLTLGRALSRKSLPNTNVGMLLPNMSGAPIAFFALQAIGRIPALLNYASGAQNILSACQVGNIKVVVSARRFIEVARLEDIINVVTTAGIQVAYLEDLQNELNWWDKIYGYYHSFKAEAVYKQWVTHPNPSDTAVILFTSGTEGPPKGVVLSHINIQANIAQISTKVDFTPDDQLFNPMPIFHSFGLTVGVLLPLLSGVKTFLYPTPLHYRIIPQMIYGRDTTITIGTNTFLFGYAKYAHPYDFYNMRYIFAGAEKLHEETRRLYIEKLGVRILEGYGTTEASPVLSINTSMENKIESVGKFLPGIKYKIKNLQGFHEGGELLVAGPNIMQGYLDPTGSGRIIPPKRGWYATGDVVKVDEDGFVYVIGRLKRFAKIAGEMVSLATVENYITAAWPKGLHAIISVPDEHKGEKLILVTTSPRITMKALLKEAKQRGLNELYVPRVKYNIKTMPLLGTGKETFNFR